ncbi:hypothetical protein JTE90_003781 [Oedothorax gibbosus]|uniref:3CxxC-type domain-containing protein n=1 Tax=Oedothorax gibbosus TaxID=931172 RepID=A0AAV6V9K1_9ARAC|nr:hypothetical protein JTE90_003781 [Oedothorax gibbosus]
MANPPARIVDPANLQALFYKIMERYQVKANEIKNLKVALVDVHGHGLFDCFKCYHSWYSHYSWVQLDLKEMKVNYRWKMKCQKCYRGHPAAAVGIKPTFGVEEMEKMIENAVCRYKGVEFPKKNPGNRRRHEFVPPHFSELCEKCGWGQVQCWTLPPYSSFKA